MMHKAIPFLAATLLAGCGKHGMKAGPASDSMKSDKVSNHDGKIASDGSNDGAIRFTISGPVVGLCVITCSATDGTPLNGQQWDTYTVGQTLPAGMNVAFRTGDPTWQLGVFDHGKLLNAPNGTLSPLPDGAHELTLWLGDSGHFSKNDHFIVLAERPDHSVVKSNIFTF